MRSGKRITTAALLGAFALCTSLATSAEVPAPEESGREAAVPGAYTPYLVFLTMFSGAGEIVDPRPHASVASCRSELVRMREAVRSARSVDGILATQGECRAYDPGTWSRAAGIGPAPAAVVAIPDAGAADRGAGTAPTAGPSGAMP